MKKLNIVNCFANEMHDNYGVTELYQMTGNNNVNYYTEVGLDDYSAVINLYDAEFDRSITEIRATTDDFDESESEVTYVDLALTVFEDLEQFLDNNDIKIETVSKVEDMQVLEKWAAKRLV